MSGKSKIKLKLKYSLAKLARVSSVVVCVLVFLSTGFTSAGVIKNVTYVGTWSTAPGSGNTPSPSGPGMATGQRYVVNIAYDDNSTVSSVPISSGGGQLMSTINLQAAGNSLEILVPMEGLDSGSPFIYAQVAADHFPAFIAAPTLNFIDGSSISDTSNIIGLEFEGNYVAGAGFNIIEMFNEGSTLNQVSQILQCSDVNCFSSSTAIRGINTLADAVDLTVDAGLDLVYNATTLMQTTASAITQSNDLGAFRSDGEDFVDVSWSQAGTDSGDDITVAIENSGLTMTTSTATWTASASEQMTGKTDSDTLDVSYENTAPIANASAIANASGVDFTFNAIDADLAVNSLIAGFETLVFSALQNGLTDATAFFADLFNLGTISYSNAELFAEFGAGSHEVVFSAKDKLGALSQMLVSFDAITGNPSPSPVPEPGTILLMLLGLVLISHRQKT